MNAKLKWLSSGIIGVLMASASISAYSAEDTSAVTTLFVELGTNALEQPENVGIGWALSAIGLSGGDQLSSISTELKAINNDLVTMSGQLSQILNAIQELDCNENINDATNAAAGIATLYNNYQVQFVNPASEGDAISATQLETWLTEMQNVPGYMTTINHFLYDDGGTASIIATCGQAIALAYADSAGNPFRDLTYYAPIQNLVNYYYGAQTQGATIMVEWLHLQACQAITPTPCDFATVSTNPPPAQAYNVCPGAQGSLAANLCQQAAEVVSNPPDASGLYELVTLQLAAAGAPYSWNGKVGIVAGYPILAPASLEDFTNTAELVTGDKVTQTPCPSPLSSDQPCGYTVGLFNAVFDEGISYASYGGVNGQSFWNNIPSSDLNANALYSALFNTYNVYLKNGTPSPSGSGIVVDGSVADYMNSIGFKNVGDKIITFHDDDHKAFDKTAVCDIFTTVTEKMPYCNKTENSSHVCSQTDHESNCSDNAGPAKTVSATKISDVIDPKTYAQGFFHFLYECDELGCSWNDKPGWLKEEASNEKFYQYRWPMLDITTLTVDGYDYCTVRKATMVGTTETPGYIQFAGPNANNIPVTYYSMCGNDLQAYIDELMPPPGTSVSQTLNAESFGAGHTLTVRATLNNVGVKKRVDVFMGMRHTDGNTISFITRLDPLRLKNRRADKPRSFRPISRNLLLESGMHSSEPYVARYTFAGYELTGSYEFFTALVKPGSLHDGSIDKGDIIAMTTDVFEFQGTPE